MSRHTPAVLLGLIFLATIAGFAALYRLRIGQGDVFPPYSSLRADPLGLQALHDSLAAVPGMEVTRRFESLGRLPSTPARIVMIAGVSVAGWETTTMDEFTPIDAAAWQGSRVVIGLMAQRQPSIDRERDARKEAEKKKAEERKSAEQKAPASDEKKADKEKEETKKTNDDHGADDEEEGPYGRKPVLADLAKLWGIALKERPQMVDAKRAAAAPADLPAELKIKSDIYFKLSPEFPWRVIYNSGGSPVFAELPRGRGSIVVVTDSYFLSNEALQKDRKTRLLAWTLGAHQRVEFDENHFGLEQDKGIASLARRYGLAGAFGTLLLLAALFIWRRLALFVPPAPESTEVALSYNQTAGLQSLLSRALTSGQLMAACVAEWRRTARPADAARLDAALVQLGPKATAGERYNAAVRALRRHGVSNQ